MTAYIDVRVRTDASDVKKELDKASGATTSASSRIKDSLKAIGGAMAAAFAVDKIKDFAVQTITAASDLNETLSKTNQIFGSSADAIVQWSEDSSNAVGMSQTAALDAADTFAIFGKSAGLTGKDLTGFSTNLVSTAADFASFANTSPAEAIDAIGAALRGETEPIRKYGLMLDDATIKQEAVRQGLIKTTKDAIDPAKKALVVNGLIQAFAKGQKIAGDFARTSGGLANQQRILSAKVDNAKASIGQALLPVMLMGIQLASKFGQVLMRMGNFIKENADAVAILAIGFTAAYLAINAAAIATKIYTTYSLIAAKATKIWAAMQALLNGVMSANAIGIIIVAIAVFVAALIYAYRHCETFRKIVQAVFRAVTAAAQVLASGFSKAFRAVVSFVTKATEIVQKVIRSLMNFLLHSPIAAVLLGPWRIAIGALNALIHGGISGVLNYFRGLLSALGHILAPVGRLISAPFKAAWESIKGVWNGAIAFFQRIVDSIKRVFDVGFSGIKSVWNGIANAINAVHISISVPSWVPLVGGKGWEWSTHIPTLAKGGYFTRPTVGLLGEAGPEFVLPEATLRRVLRDENAGGTTVNVYGALDPDAVARQIAGILRKRAQRVGGISQRGQSGVLV